MARSSVLPENIQVGVMPENIINRFPGFDCTLSADFDLQFALAVSRALESKELAQLLEA